MKNKKSMNLLVKLVTVAMLSAVAFVLYLLEFPILPGASHLQLDLGDIPALIGGLVCGPVWGVVIEFIKNVLQLFVKGLGSQMGFGNVMNFIVGSAYIVPFCLVYKSMSKKEEIKKPVAVTVASIVGIISILVIGIGGNYLIDPPYFKYFLGVELTSETLWPAIWSATALNAVKGVMLSIVSFPIVLALLDRLKKVAKF
ncbi:MAG: ECF transporter S component [Faecalibacterium sp.]|nr:ECF transporter S component [Ruminococcus sp.]MCM1391502.1 ECF transporter S component [Ruminococcus sp.]MCM1485866.1 ECF transporter S component [Faecalibacterium sp.]